jgi:hypothetical protein
MERLDLVDFSGGLDNFNPPKLVGVTQGVDYTNINPEFKGLYPSDSLDNIYTGNAWDYGSTISWSHGSIHINRADKNFDMWSTVLAGHLYYSRSNSKILYYQDSGGSSYNDYNKSLSSFSYVAVGTNLGIDTVACSDAVSSNAHKFYGTTIANDRPMPFSTRQTVDGKDCEGFNIYATFNTGSDTTANRHIKIYKNGGTVSGSGALLIVDMTIPDVADMKSGGTLDGSGAWTNPAYPNVAMIDAGGGSTSYNVSFNENTPASVNFYRVHEDNNEANAPYNTVANQEIYISVADILLDTSIVDEYKYFLTYYKGCLFSVPSTSFTDGKALGTDILYYTEPDNPNAWLGTNFIQFPGLITGLALSYAGVFVFLENAIYLVSGNAEPWQVDIVSSSIGCSSDRTIRVIDNTIVFMSNKGLATINGNSLTLVSDKKVDMDSTNSNAVQMATTAPYTYLIFSYPYLWILDMTLYAIKRFSLSAEFESAVSMYYNKSTNKTVINTTRFGNSNLNTPQSGYSYHYGSDGDYETISYKSPELLINNTSRKRLHSLVVDSTYVDVDLGTITIDKIISGSIDESEDLVITQNGLQSFYFKARRPYDSIQISYTGRSGINSISLSFDTLSLSGNKTFFTEITVEHSDACQFDVRDEEDNQVSFFNIAKSLAGSTKLMLHKPAAARYLYISEITFEGVYYITDYKVA